MKAKALKKLEKDLEREGLKPDSFAYQAELRKRKVEMCVVRQGVESCWKCPYFDHCELVKHHLRDLRFHWNGPNAPQKARRDPTDGDGSA